MRTLIQWLAPGIACAMLVACGGDDNGAAPGGGDASFNDVNNNPGDDGPSPGSDANPLRGDAMRPPDGGDGGGPCNFATFVKGLIATDTTGSALPSTDLGQSCTDNNDQAEFKSLFP